MCLLTYFPARAMPDATALLHGATANDDGHGYAIVTPTRILTRRSMAAADLIDAFADARRAHPDGPALFHSRFSTHGETSLDNCHPFLVGGDPRTVLAHNGVLPSIVQPAPKDPRSDTRIAAEEFLGRPGALRTRRSRLQIEKWMTPANKMVILTIDRRFTQQSYILNEESGIWDGGIWYSNGSYLPPPPHRSRPLWSWDLAEDSSGRCLLCCAILDPADAVCTFCGACQDCGEDSRDCQCYPPANRGRTVILGAHHRPT
jgi:hypothetical protein